MKRVMSELEQISRDSMVAYCLTLIVVGLGASAGVLFLRLLAEPLGPLVFGAGFLLMVPPIAIATVRTADAIYARLRRKRQKAEA